MSLFVAMLVLCGPFQTPDATPRVGFRSYAGDYAVEVGEVFDLKADIDVPVGHKIIRQRWVFPQQWNERNGRRIGQKRYIGSAKPGRYAVTYEAETAETFEFAVPGTDPPRVVEVSIVGSHTVHEYTFSIVVEGPQPQPDAPTTEKIDRVTYIHEREDGGVPREVAATFRDLAKEGITASVIDDDIRDGEGQVPEQFKAALAAAGDLPCAVFQAGAKVVRVVSRPETAAQIREAMK